MAWRYAISRFREVHPLDVQASLLNACNLHCVYCRCPEVKTSLLTTDQWKGIIRDLGAMGAVRIKFQGGEPTMRPDFRELAGESRAQGLVTAVITNGQLIPHRPDLLDHLDELIVSLDAPSAKINDRLRGAGSWQLAVSTIDLACARGLRTFVNMVLTQENLGDLEGMLDFCRARGIQLHAQPIMLAGRFYESGARSHALDDRQIRQVHQQLARWKQEGQPLMFSSATYSKVANWQDGYTSLAVKAAGESTCMAGRYYIHIDPNGDVHPCVSHNATFTPKNIAQDGLRAALRHVKHHNCGDCWIAYLNERKLAFGLRPQALLEIARRG
jgi:MoaA/NifB/PqqE/SkfB family radical SAM enzyme